MKLLARKQNQTQSDLLTEIARQIESVYLNGGGRAIVMNLDLGVLTIAINLVPHLIPEKEKQH